MAKGNLLVVRRALLIFAFAISLGAGNAFADMQGDFTFWFSVVKIEEVNPGAIMLSGTVAGLPVRVLLDANAKVSDSRPPDMGLGLFHGAGALLLAKVQYSRRISAQPCQNKS